MRLAPTLRRCTLVSLAPALIAVGCADPTPEGVAARPTAGVVFGNGDVSVSDSATAELSPDTQATEAVEAAASDTATPTAADTQADTATTAPPETVDHADTADTAPEAVGCGEETVALTHVAPGNVLLVVDRSNSMKGAKWAAAKSAIDEIAAAYQATLRLGLLLFPQAKNDCSVSPFPDVAVALGSAGDIQTTLDDAELFLSTPTASAIVAAGTILANVPHDAPRVVVLATDGQPTCPTTCGTCTAPANGGCAAGSCDLCVDVHACAAHQLVEAVDTLAAQGVLTYVVGLPGSEAATDTLNAVADAGGTALAGATRYYTATDAGSLAATLGTIAGNVTSCSAEVTPANGSGFATVHINGVEVNRDSAHAAGWDLVGGHTLQFYGAACSAASAAGAEVSITWGCKH